MKEQPWPPQSSICDVFLPFLTFSFWEAQDQLPCSNWSTSAHFNPLPWTVITDIAVIFLNSLLINKCGRHYRVLISQIHLINSPSGRPAPPERLKSSSCNPTWIPSGNIDWVRLNRSLGCGIPLVKTVIHNQNRKATWILQMWYW